MNENDFTNNRAGKLVWETAGAYFRFEPTKLPLELKSSPALEAQAQKTALMIGKVDGLMQKFSHKEIEIIQTPFILKEAALSSEIEGTRSTITDIYKEQKIKETDIEKHLDNEEVRNYREALSFALRQTPEQITVEFIKEIHKILLRGVRGQDKNPGEYKTYQNAIGRRDDNLDTAKFVPASPQTTPDLMNNLVSFINNPLISPLYKIAVTHYQFEAIHPFKDGNGRLGRLLIVLQLCREKYLTQPLIYVSEYINRNRDTYLDLLYASSSQGKIEELILFLLKAIEVQATQSMLLLSKIENYKKDIQIKMKDLSQSPNMHVLIDSLFKQPFFNVRDVKDILKVSQPAAWNLVQKLKKQGIVKEFKVLGSKRKIYAAEHLLTILEGRDERR